MIRDLDLLRIHHAVGCAGRLVRMSQYGASEAEIEDVIRNSGLGFAADVSGKFKRISATDEQTSVQTAECFKR